MEMETVDKFRGMKGPTVVNSPQFKREHHIVWRLLWVVRSGRQSRRAFDQSSAWRNHQGANDPRQKAVGCGDCCALMIGCGVGIIGNWRMRQTSVLNSNSRPRLQRSELHEFEFHAACW